MYEPVAPPKLESEDGGRLVLITVALSTSLLIAMISSVLVVVSYFIFSIEVFVDDCGFCQSCFVFEGSHRSLELVYL